jgi:hypothetical protein
MQNPTTTLGWLFQERPFTWGLRGDPHVWDEMERVLGEHPLPPSSEA